MTDGNTYAINKHLDEREDYDALQEVTTELEQAEARIEELEGRLAKAFIVVADLYRLHLRSGPAWDHAGTKEVMDSACAILAELSKERSDEKGQDDEAPQNSG